LALKRLAGHFWRTLMGHHSMVLGFYAVSMLPLADARRSPLPALFLGAGGGRDRRREGAWRRWSATIVGFVGVW